MPIDRFSGAFVVKTRDQVRDEWLRDFKFRQPDADITEGSLVWLDASTAADATMPLYNDVRVISNAIDVDNANTEQLNRIGLAEIGPRRPASGSQGYVYVVASSGGGQIVEGTILRHTKTRAEYQALVTDTYANGSRLSVGSLSTGIASDLPAGTVLEFENPPIGIGALATVDEDGISGGGPEEDDPTYRQRIKDARRDPPAAANWAHYVAAIESVPGISVEKGFAIPAPRGAGTVALLFTMRPASLGASRIPNGAQIAAIEAAVMADMPFDDGAEFCALVEEGVAVELEVTWQTGAAGWVDVAPWPADGASTFVIDDATSPTFFAVSGSGAAPVVGKTMALYDATNKRFVAKRITDVVDNGGGFYDLETDTTSVASDTSYLPLVGQLVSPWSASLPDIVTPVLTYFAKQGPGEQVNIPPDPNGRKIRFPQSPAFWPSVITSRLTDGVDDLPAVLNVGLLAPTTPLATTIGSLGVSSYLHVLSDLAVYPES